MAAQNNKPQRVFISYSHDNKDHRKKILRLSNLLRSKGLECFIDQYVEDVDVPENWPKWTAEQIETADYVLMACTPAYRLRFEGKKARAMGSSVGKGSDWEGAFINNELYNGVSGKYIPIVFDDSEPTAVIPGTLQAKTYYRLDSGVSYPEFGSGFVRLYRRLTTQATTKVPGVGSIEVLGVYEVAGGEGSAASKNTRPPSLGRAKGDFEAAKMRMGFSIGKLSCSKSIDKDGKCVATYRVEKLEVHGAVPLQSLEFFFETKVGVLLEPEVEVLGSGRFVSWEGHRPLPDESMSFAFIVRSQQEILGEFKFHPPIDRGDSVSFQFTFITLNGGATDVYEYYLLYGPDKRHAVDGGPFLKPCEYMFRPIWWPIKQFEMKVEVPFAPNGNFHLIKYFASPTSFSTSPEPSSVGRYPDFVQWEFANGEEVSKMKSGEPNNPLQASYTLRYPAIGSGLCLKWCFSSGAAETEDVIMANDATRRARKVLLPYAGMRARNASDKSRYDFCSKTFNSLAKELQTDYGSGEPSERFDVSFMVFDEEMKALRIVCGYLSGSPLPSRWQGFSFQPGIGIAGSCFKWGDRVTLFIRGSKWPEDPGLYTEIAGFNQLNERHQVLLSLPIYEKSYSKRLTQSALSSKSEKEMQMEARRHIIGVMNVGSNSIQSKLYQLRRSGTSLETDPAADRIVPAIVAKCQMMADLFILHSEER